MLQLSFQAIRLLVVFTLITGVAYPLFVTGFAQSAFPDRANGSLIRDGDVVRGSRLVGQSFSGPQYFWSRPSATAPAPYNGAASSGSNQGPTNPALQEAVAGRVSALRAVGGDPAQAVPVDLVTASASGLDPHISPAAAQYQVPRVAVVRHMPEAQLLALVRDHTEGRQWGVLGEPRVNVLMLNLALDRLRGEPRK